jgi:hypothetical protein
MTEIRRPCSWTRNLQPVSDSNRPVESFVIERHGLVDYEYGVWEEQIIESALPLSLRDRVFVLFTNRAFFRGMP